MKVMNKKESKLIYKRALRNKILVPPYQCSQCKLNYIYKMCGHHEDYSKPLKVIWLCRNCHSKIHKNPMIFKNLEAIKRLKNELKSSFKY